MTEWREVTLGDVIELKRGYDLPKRARADGPFPIVSSSGISGRHAEAKVRGPGVVTGRYGTLGQVFYIASDFWPLNTSLYVRDFKGNNERFVALLLESMDLAQHDGAAAVPGLNRNQLHTVPVRVPDRYIQDRIASVVESVDDLIENIRRRVEVLEEMARAIYREWFVRFRYPGHERVPLVDSPLGPIPDGWRVAPLDSIAAVNRESRTPRHDEVVRYLDISALGERSVGQLSQVGGDAAPGRARRVVRAGDVVWSMVRPNRRAHALLVDPGADWIASTGLAVLSPVVISSSWLFEMTSTQEFSDYLVSQEGGAAYPAVKPKDFERAPVVVPTPALDSTFAQRVAPLHQLGWQLRAQSSELASLRDHLLPRLVTGRIVVSRLDFEALTEAATA